ncbi:hypothetical protein GCM10027346_36100 [Hymenobacter seoulensis]
MKTTIFLALSILLAGCNSASVKPDPRVAVIRQQHEQLLAHQKEYNALLSALTGSEKLSPSHIRDSQQRFADFVQQSQSNLQVLDQLDEARSQDPAQLKMVGELAAKETNILERAKRRLSNVHNEHYVP